MSDHLVIALFGAAVAILGLLFLVAHLFEHIAKLRMQRDEAMALVRTSNALLKQIGLRPRPPDGGKAE